MMQHKRFKFSMLFFWVFGLSGLLAQTMHVKEINDTQTDYSLSHIRKIIFSTGNINVQKTDNSTDSYSLSLLRNLNFTYLSTQLVEQRIQNPNLSMDVYPNPVVDLLTIDLTYFRNESGTINIVSLDGQIMQSQKVTGATIVTLNLSQLVKGFYLCSFSNTTEFKSVKIIKQ